MSKLRRVGRRIGGHFFEAPEPRPDQVFPRNTQVVSDAEITKFINDLALLGWYEDEHGGLIKAHQDQLANARSWIDSRMQDPNRAAAFWGWAQEKAQLMYHGHLQSIEERYPLMFGHQAN